MFDQFIIRNHSVIESVSYQKIKRRSNQMLRTWEIGKIHLQQCQINLMCQLISDHMEMGMKVEIRTFDRLCVA